MAANLSPADFVRNLEGMPTPRERPTFVAISGFGGSGKSTLAQKIAHELRDSTVIPIDDFIVGARTQRSGDWATFDRGRLKKDILERAKIGQSLRYQVFNSGDFVAGRNNKSREVTIGNFVIIEGCGIIHPDLTDFYDCSAWINLPQERALESAKSRDAHEQALFGDDDTAKLWDEVWGPNDRDFFDTFRPDLHATVLIEPQF